MLFFPFFAQWLNHRDDSKKDVNISLTINRVNKMKKSFFFKVIKTDVKTRKKRIDKV